MHEHMLVTDRLSIACISPLNPLRSGISDYTETLLPFLAEFFDLTLYSDCGVRANPLIAEQFPVYPVSDLYKHHLRHDLRLYQIGNSPHHQSAFEALRTLPGVIVLHEPFLHHGLYYSSPLHYRRELFYELGIPDWARLKYMEQALMNDDRQALMDIPMIGRIVDSSLGILVHSQTARRIVETRRAKSAFCRPRLPKIMVVAQPMSVPDSDEMPECRARFGLPQDALIFGMAGFIHPVKEPYLALQAFARLQSDFPQAMFLFAGEILQETGDLLAFARDLGLGDKVIILGRVEPLERLHQAMSACDIILNLRRTTIGETSGIALRTMALGKPIIVRNIGWFGELPDETCVKIGPEDGVEELAALMKALATSPEMRLRLGQEARRYVERECDPRRVARQYAEFLWDVYLSIGQSRV
jgi:glycosyltransferase involved in cell wall biosynthesis